MSITHNYSQYSVIVFLIISISFVTSCTRENVPKEYFESHGMTYPVDVSGISIFAVNYVGIEEEEVMAPGAREYVQAGVTFIKGYFQMASVNGLIPGTIAMTVDKPVLYRGDTEDVGLMVRLTAFGSGTHDDKLKLPIEWVVKDNDLWKVVNFAYFIRRGLYDWQYGGLVF
jgi:hypothetical protein